MKLNAKETQIQFGKTCDKFVDLFEDWANNNGIYPVDNYYGSVGYTDEHQSSVSGASGSK
jgi:hypothetical protein